jgi:hypothetical protein
MSWKIIVTDTRTGRFSFNVDNLESEEHAKDIHDFMDIDCFDDIETKIVEDE